MPSPSVHCTRCSQERWVPTPYLELDDYGRRTSRPPVGLTEGGYPCQRCRAVLAGRSAADPLPQSLSPAKAAALAKAQAARGRAQAARGRAQAARQRLEKAVSVIQEPR